MRKKKTPQNWLKIILPLSIVGVMMGLFLLHRGNISSEVVVEYDAKPWTSEGCKIDGPGEKNKNPEK